MERQIDKQIKREEYGRERLTFWCEYTWCGEADRQTDKREEYGCERLTF